MEITHTVQTKTQFSMLVPGVVDRLKEMKGMGK